MRRRRYSGKLNNVGMSLVEVVIAMAIMSIVILPVLHTFVQSARYNATARMRQQTTAAAQTVMENFKAYSVQEICDQFDADTFNVSRGSGFATSYTGTPGGNMEFVINGMRYEGANYDVRVELEGHSSGAADVESLVYTTRTKEHDAVYTGYAGMDADALTGILQEVADEWSAQEAAAAPAPSASPSPTAAPAAHAYSEVDSSKVNITERRITVNISNASGNYVAKVTCEYDYTVTAHPYTVDSSGTTGTFDMAETYELDLSGSTDPTNMDFSKTIFDQPTELTGLTLYYYPAYGYGAGSPVQIDRDYIIINNTCGNEVKCYIYKQKNLAVSDTKISTSELVYEVNLQLAGANIYDDNLNTVLGNDAASIPDSKIHINGGSRYLGVGIASVEGDLNNLDPTSDAALINLLNASRSKTVESLRLMYGVRISVYNSGDLAGGGTPLNTLEGTIIE